MGIQVTLKRRRQQINPGLFARYPTGLIEEIEDYKRQTERLARIYDLHRKLGETLDLDAMTEAFSRWLSLYLGHSLVAYRHFGQNRLPTACSCHGPHRRQLLDVAMELMQWPVRKVRNGRVREMGLYYHLWPLSPQDDDCLLLFHTESRSINERSFRMVEEVLQELRGPLQRALAYEELYNQARRDALTGLVNRRVFEERITLEMANAERHGLPLVLACLDLDYFKSVNDKMGHAEGDAVLKRVSQTFREIVRDTDLLARVGGDEFAMILPHTTLDNAQQLMDRLCQSVADLDIRAEGSPPLGVSIGLAAWKPGIAYKDLWNQSDAALYRAKSGGRCQVSQ